ncbi:MULTISPECIES: hypothetical protein [Cyanophyceae]|uniref:hypothetical protein n=1 Tax=Cyanophyceae TaxID=3028117 RepID=UPI00168208AD|nr:MULTISPECIES: hypothetical protein [Cyanophyceae]MBD1914315.1 hypothetical protein [Phormidium sp. FACHB-77]MBD2031249.1 hypothetical protein [Phormidium sp. FACHB-322]MBD2049649.1 hypothetical protein [Leptolyngbya sp. FACHB-60]
MHKLHCTTQAGWAIHVYNCDRRLLCTIGPSHGWVFMSGLAFGLVVSIIGYNLPHSSAAASPPPLSPDFVAPLQLD